MTIGNKTTNDLAKSVLLKLGVIRAEGTPKNVDAEFVKNTYSLKFLELENDGLVYWEETVIPDLVFLSLIKIMAFECGPEFGIERDDGLLMDGIDSLRRIQTRKTTDEPVEIQNF